MCASRSARRVTSRRSRPMRRRAMPGARRVPSFPACADRRGRGQRYRCGPSTGGRYRALHRRRPPVRCGNPGHSGVAGPEPQLPGRWCHHRWRAILASAYPCYTSRTGDRAHHTQIGFGGLTLRCKNISFICDNGRGTNDQGSGCAKPMVVRIEDTQVRRRGTADEGIVGQKTSPQETEQL